MMNKLAVSLAAGAAALFVSTVVSPVNAAPLMPTSPAIDNGVENVRLVCNEWGRCWRERGPRYGYRGSYGYYAPDYGYGYRRSHYYNRPGVYFGGPGVSFGFGVGPSW
ncbi:hypothetical protein [Afipia sp. P52-10]|uniref:hypothetical protein n=1 Tax=Afipia sp. P52-10 TaxID=1429916 RepID=UPI0031B82706